MAKETFSADTAQIISLLTEHQADLWAYILSQLPGSPDVADVLQQSNLAIWTNRNQFEIGTNFRAWAFTIVRYEVLSYLQKHKRGKWLMFNDELLDVVATEASDHMSDSTVRLQLLEGCMSKLPHSQQDLLQHRYIHKDGMSNYANAVGRSKSALYVTLHRVRAKLRKCIESGLTNKTGTTSKSV